mmetsp:Transcript_18979/g.23533  ORF Transcript_18979/g.23533 Transcript_18979/m.23533 type:complete len:275 (+) Transcript_18979:1318-2142(+)
MAPKLTDPPNGKPANPPMLKFVLYTSDKSVSRGRFTSSQHKDVATRVLLLSYPAPSKTSSIIDTNCEFVNAPGNALVAWGKGASTTGKVSKSSLNVGAPCSTLHSTLPLGFTATFDDDAAAAFAEPPFITVATAAPAATAPAPIPAPTLIRSLVDLAAVVTVLAASRAARVEARAGEGTPLAAKPTVARAPANLVSFLRARFLLDMGSSAPMLSDTSARENCEVGTGANAADCAAKSNVSPAVSFIAAFFSELMRDKTNCETNLVFRCEIKYVS